MSKQIEAFVLDESGQLVPLTSDSLILRFPSGDSLEIAWDALHPDAPVCAQVWGGRRSATCGLASESGKPQHPSSPVAILPSASNLVLVYPYSYRERK
jgi:hypothetical protein